MAMIQFNGGEHVVDGANIAEAICTEKDIVFNESYIVVGEILRGKKIYATYDLSVHGNIEAEDITVNGSLYVIGDIHAKSLTCHGKMICTGTIDVMDINLDDFSVADSIKCEKISVTTELVLQSTIDVDKSMKVDKTFIAGEGVVGAGTFEAEVAIVNEYFEFDGKVSGNVLEVAEMRTIESSFPVRKQPNNTDIEQATNLFNNVFCESCKEWSEYDEEDFIAKLKKTAVGLPALNTIATIIDLIIEISYQKKIENLRDYLFIVWANEVFTEELSSYETIEGVFGSMFDDAADRIGSLDFKAKNVFEFALSLYILEKYSNILPASHDDLADKIFASIGLRYTTVKHVLNGGGL